MTDLVERLRAKPEPVRKVVALGAATGFTGLVAIAWAVSFTSSAAFALSAPDDAAGPRPGIAEEESASLLSAVGALMKQQEGVITVAGTRASSTVPAPKADERTVIPF